MCILRCKVFASWQVGCIKLLQGFLYGHKNSSFSKSFAHGGQGSVPCTPTSFV